MLDPTAEKRYVRFGSALNSQGLVSREAWFRSQSRDANNHPFPLDVPGGKSNDFVLSLFLLAPCMDRHQRAEINKPQLLYCLQFANDGNWFTGFNCSLAHDPEEIQNTRLHYHYTLFLPVQKSERVHQMNELVMLINNSLQTYLVDLH
jgi:hypothetical protein